MFYILWNIFCTLIEYFWIVVIKIRLYIDSSFFSPLIVETNLLSVIVQSTDFFFRKKKEKREKITPRERKERVSSKSNSKWKIVKKGGEKRKQNAYQRELMKMAGYRGTNEIAGVLGCAATRLARNVDEVKRSQGNWRTFQM